MAPGVAAEWPRTAGCASRCLLLGRPSVHAATAPRYSLSVFRVSLPAGAQAQVRFGVCLGLAGLLPAGCLPAAADVLAPDLDGAAGFAGAVLAEALAAGFPAATLRG